jgi:hypothetical protein
MSLLFFFLKERVESHGYQAVCSGLEHLRFQDQGINHPRTETRQWYPIFGQSRPKFFGVIRGNVDLVPPLSDHWPCFGTTY